MTCKMRWTNCSTESGFSVEKLKALPASEDRARHSAKCK